MSIRSLLLVASLAAVAVAHDTRRVSVDATGEESDRDSGTSGPPPVSRDGTHVAFASYATNLVPGDTNHSEDVFVHELSTGLVERVSVDSTGTEGDFLSNLPAISGDGQVVAFQSGATNLVLGDTNGSTDVFVRDRAAGTTVRVSIDSAGVEGNSYSEHAALSDDGQIVAFDSLASNLVAGDTNGALDVFVHDRSTGVTTRVSLDSAGAEGNGHSFDPTLSADGNFVVFSSVASNLVTGDANLQIDVFVHDRSTGVTTRVSLDSAGAEGNGYSFDAAVSADGQLVAFRSRASNLVAGDTNGCDDVFVHDRSSGTTTRVSVDSAGAEGHRDSSDPAISDDGLLVAFESLAVDLVAGDTNGQPDVFVHDRSTGITERVSVGTAGAEGNDVSVSPSMSGDGRVLTYGSAASNLVIGDTNRSLDIFVREPCADARWTNYGAGLAGTLGVPSLTAQADPVLGATLTVDVGNSLGATTVGILLFGIQRAKLPFKDGVLQLHPVGLSLVAIPVAGLTLGEDVPDDEALCGVEIVAQVIEADSGAPRNLSFTQGLALLLGR